MYRSHPSRRSAVGHRILGVERLEVRCLLAANISHVPFWDGETSDGQEGDGETSALINRLGGPLVDGLGGLTVARDTDTVRTGQGAFRIRTNGTLPPSSFDFFGLALTGFGPSDAYVDTRNLTRFERIEFWLRNETSKPFNLTFEIKDYRGSNDHRAQFTSPIPAGEEWTRISMPLDFQAGHGWQLTGNPDLARAKLFALVIETGPVALNGSFLIDDMVLVERGGPLSPHTADTDALVDRLIWRSFHGLWGSRDRTTALVPDNSTHADVMALNSTAGLIAMLPTAIEQDQVGVEDANGYVGTVVDTLSTVWDKVAATGNGGFLPPRYIDRVTLAPASLREESSVDAALLFLPLYAYRELPTTPDGLQQKINVLLDRFHFDAFSSPRGWRLAYRYEDREFTPGTYDGYSTEIYVISLAAHLAANHRVEITEHWDSGQLRVWDHLVDLTESHLVHTQPEFRPPFSQWLLSLLVDVRGRGADTYPHPELAGNPYWNAVKYQREVHRKLEELGRPTFVQPDAGDDGSGRKYDQFSLYCEHGEPDLFMPWSVAFAFLADPQFAEQALRDMLGRGFHGPLGLSDSVKLRTGTAAPDALAARTDFWNQTLATLALIQYRHGSSEVLTTLPEVQAALDKVLPPDGNRDSDGDGVPDKIEDAAPHHGDGNRDGLPDRLQRNVTSLPNSGDGHYLTLAVSGDAVLRDVRAVANPSPADAPPGIDFPAGFLDFLVAGIEPGEAVSLELFVHQTPDINALYRFGTTANLPVPHWRPSLRGADRPVDGIRLQLDIGGERDKDQSADGTIRVRVAAGADRRSTPWQNPWHPCDVNGDRYITPLDALVLINEINTNGSRELPVPREVVSGFLDVSGNHRLDPLDVLLVINDLNANGARSVLEGESTTTHRPADPTPEGEPRAWYPDWLLSAEAEPSADRFFNRLGWTPTIGDRPPSAPAVPAASAAAHAPASAFLSRSNDRDRFHADRFPKQRPPHRRTDPDSLRDALNIDLLLARSLPTSLNLEF